MLDLPLPLGPTTTAMPSSNRNSTPWANDLKPRMRTAFRYISRLRSGLGERPQRLPRRFLLGCLLAGTRAPAQLSPLDDRRRGEETVVVGADRVDQEIGYRHPLTCKLLLEHRLVIDVLLEHVLDPAGER